jgi:hypothetical protein
MPTNSLYAEHISTNLANYEAARSGFFTLLVDINKPDDKTAADAPMARATYDGTDPKQAPTISGADVQELIKLNVLTFDVPHFELETLQYKRGNEVVKFAGTPTFNSGSLKVDDVVGVDTKSVLMAWQALAYNVHTRKGGRMADYKRNCTLIEYTQDYAQVRQWRLYGCWVKSLSEDAFDRENDGKRAITATIEYDRAVMLEPDNNP